LGESGHSHKRICNGTVGQAMALPVARRVRFPEICSQMHFPKIATLRRENGKAATFLGAALRVPIGTVRGQDRPGADRPISAATTTQLQTFDSTLTRPEFCHSFTLGKMPLPPQN
jgi:hypothetical protein